MTESNDQETTALKCECRAEEIVFLPCSGLQTAARLPTKQRSGLLKRESVRCIAWLVLEPILRAWWSLPEEPRE